MSIQKKSLISTLKTAKKANVASAPISEREPKAQQQASPQTRFHTKNLRNFNLKNLKAPSMKNLKNLKAPSMKNLKNLRGVAR